jgi:two-component system, NarL family, sensor histidine kinase UhpB
MKQTKSLPYEIAFINLATVVILLLVIYIYLPYLNINLPYVYTMGFEWLIVSFVLISTVFLFLITRYFLQKIEKERKLSSEMAQRYEALSAAASDAIWDYNLLTGNTFYNERIHSIFGYSESDTLNNSDWWSENIHREDRKRVEEKINSYLINGTTCWEEEYRFRCKDGSYKIVYDRSYIVFNDSKHPVRLIGAMKDISKQREHENKIHELQLEQKTRIGKEIIKSNEAEKRRLKDDLQEDINQILASVKLNMSSVEKKPCVKPIELDESISQLTIAMSKIRNITNKLHSSTFDFFGLPAAIQEILSDIEDKYGIPTLFNKGSFNERESNPTHHLIILRVVQAYCDSLIERKPSEISVYLSGTYNKMLLEIKDKNAEVQMDQNVLEIALADLKNKITIYKGELSVEVAKDNGLRLFIII